MKIFVKTEASNNCVLKRSKKRKRDEGKIWGGRRLL